MKTFIPLVIAVGLGGAAQAQDFYAGGALDYGFPHSGDSQVVASGLAGVGWSTSTFGYGAEVEFGIPLGEDNGYDTQRLRAWGTYDLGRVEARVVGGITQYAFEGNTDNGFNLGVGLQRDISNRVTLRGEFIRDFLDDSFTVAVTTTRIGAVYNF